MKTLNQNFAGFDIKFVWQNEPVPNMPPASAESVKSSLQVLKDTAKKKTARSLEELKKDNDFISALTSARNELTNYRKSLLDGDTKPIPSLSEDFVEDIIRDTVQFSDTDALESELGLNLSIEQKGVDNDKGIDQDDVLDLDEFSKSQGFVGKNITKMVLSLMNVENGTAQLKKLQESLGRISIKVSDMDARLTTELTTGNLDSAKRRQMENQIEVFITTELAKDGFDIGIMLEEFAKLARANGETSNQDIDIALAEFVADKPPASETGEAPAGSMEDLYMKNLELAKFLAEYYPPGDFEADTKAAGVTTVEQLPDFFLTTRLGNESQSIEKSLINFEGKFDELKAKILADINNDNQAQSLGGGIMDMFNDIWSDTKSNMPESCRHFVFTAEDVNAATSVKELFANKIASLLGQDDKTGKNTINFEGVKNLARKLDQNTVDVKMIRRLTKDVPPEYGGKDGYGEKYRQAIIDGKTRKSWKEWMKKDSGISKLERVGNVFGNFMTKLARLCIKLGIFKEWAQGYIDDEKKENENESDIEKSLKEKEAVVNDQEKVKNNKELWEKAPAQEVEDYMNFQRNNAKILNFVNPTIAKDANNKTSHEGFGIISPTEFKEWNNPFTKPILEWANNIAGAESISRENWNFIVENRENIKVINGNPSVLEIKKTHIKNHQSSIKIDKWNNDSIVEMTKEDTRTEKFNELVNDKILTDDFNPDSFFKYEKELFKNPENKEDKNLKPFFRYLFGSKLNSYRGGYQISPEDLKIIIDNAHKMDDGLNEEIEPGMESNDYWTIYPEENGKVEEVHDGYLVSDESIEIADGEEQKTFEVNMDSDFGWKGMFDEDFTSVQALIERLKK